MLPILLLPALILQAPQSAIPGAAEVRPGVFVLKGLPNDTICAAIKKQHITHVIDLRRDTEPNLDCESEASRLQELDVQYLRYAIGIAPPAGDFDFLRAIIRDLPRGSKVLIHCSNGNRAAAAVCPWLVLDKGMTVDEAIAVSRTAGMKAPATEAAVRRYLSSKGRT